jgi:hypothetical protein
VIAERITNVFYLYKNWGVKNKVLIIPSTQNFFIFDPICCVENLPVIPGVTPAFRGFWGLLLPGLHFLASLSLLVLW